LFGCSDRPHESLREVAIAVVQPGLLEDRVAVVTGGGRGIGRVFAEALAAAGATVAVTGRSRGELEATAARIEAAGGRAALAVFDVADAPAAERGLSELESRLGRIDLLVNNAGMWGPIDNLWEADPEAWRRTIEVHVGGTFNCSRAVLPGMVRRGDGRIVNVVSNAGVHRWPTCSAYSVSKAAVIKLTENLAVETRALGVGVFAFHPGLLEIGLGEEAKRMQPASDTAAGRVAAWLHAEFAAGRTVEPERAAAFLLALASGRADGLSGCYLTVKDDLDALEARAREIQRDDLLTLRLRDA
jgi:NAD(P)-dependent dehydrogenase (short-subunit alcohol dehydrogenase family)